MRRSNFFLAMANDMKSRVLCQVEVRVYVEEGEEERESGVNYSTSTASKQLYPPNLNGHILLFSSPN